MLSCSLRTPYDVGIFFPSTVEDTFSQFILSHIAFLSSFKLYFLVPFPGLIMATHSMIRAISPTIGGFLYGYLGFPIFGIVGTIINGCLAFYLFHYGREQLA